MEAASVKELRSRLMPFPFDGSKAKNDQVVDIEELKKVAAEVGEILDEREKEDSI